MELDPKLITKIRSVLPVEESIQYSDLFSDVKSSYYWKEKTLDNGVPVYKLVEEVSEDPDDYMYRFIPAYSDDDLFGLMPKLLIVNNYEFGYAETSYIEENTRIYQVSFHKMIPGRKKPSSLCYAYDENRPAALAHVLAHIKQKGYWNVSIH
jgi:hypothetical protein